MPKKKIKNITNEEFFKELAKLLYHHPQIRKWGYFWGIENKPYEGEAVEYFERMAKLLFMDEDIRKCCIPANPDMKVQPDLGLVHEVLWQLHLMAERYIPDMSHSR